MDTEWQTELPRELDDLQKILESHISANNCTARTDIEKALVLLHTVKCRVQDLMRTSFARISLDDLQKPWRKLGEGHFGQVFQAVFRGSRVAVKLFKREAKIHIRESNLLRCISHENIIAYRGFGFIESAEREEEIKRSDASREMLQREDSLWDSGRSSGTEGSYDSGVNDRDYPKMFFIMEYLEKDLYRYVIDMETHERHGLPVARAWDIGKQLTGALSYLHSLDIAHRDLKPDNVLVKSSPNQLVVKIADFGLAWKDMSFHINPIKYGSSLSGSLINIRWAPPEFRDMNRNRTLDECKNGDIYCFGLVLFFTVSGMRPFTEIGSDNFHLINNIDDALMKKVSESPDGVLKDVLSTSLSTPETRPTANAMYDRYFSTDNPYKEFVKEGELFSCGFMQNTEIYVADSCTTEDGSQQGFYDSGIRPLGYNHKDLVCPIVTEKAPYREREQGWIREQEYIENYQEFKDQADRNVIDNNVSVALKKIALLRNYANKENQRIKLYFKKTEYVHHRTMRKIWMSLSREEKLKEIPSKGEVHRYFSNSFGVHISVLTNEGPNNSQKFIFPQRAVKRGIPAPGAFTCGAVESVTTPDISELDDDDSNDVIKLDVDDEYKHTRFRVDLVHAAARGLREELGIDLRGEDLEAICLMTVYLKLDTHEWGLCGFVDLKDPRVRPENRLSARNIDDMFTSGPKDKFAHKSLNFITFELEPMVDFVSTNHEHFASSAKLVVVKVLQAFFGWSKVQNAFNR